jgi:hypothetical protein
MIQNEARKKRNNWDMKEGKNVRKDKEMNEMKREE